MITIHHEVSIDVGAMDEHAITLWLISYGETSDRMLLRDWPQVLNALRHFCAEQGWLLESGDDPYQEDNLAVFAQGFSTPLQGRSVPPSAVRNPA